MKTAKKPAHKKGKKCLQEKLEEVANLLEKIKLRDCLRAEEDDRTEQQRATSKAGG